MLILQNAKSDGVHEVGHDQNGKITSIAHFDYGEVDRRLGFEDKDDMISFSDASAALALILQWMCGSSRNGQQSPIVSAGMRAHALLWLLDPTHARYQSTPEIAEAAGISRAAVSKCLMVLRDQLDGILPLRGTGARENCRKAQIAAVAANVHASQRKREKQLAEVS